MSYLQIYQHTDSHFRVSREASLSFQLKKSREYRLFAVAANEPEALEIIETRRQKLALTNGAAPVTRAHAHG